LAEPRFGLSTMPDTAVHTRWIALTRAVSPTLAQCELTHVARTAIDFETACLQHHAYEQLLAASGCDLRRVAAAPELPDAVFIEDTAVVVDELAVLTRPGAASRRGETAAVETVLLALRPVVRIAAPGTLDGGDVLTVGRDVYVGRTARTNAAGIAQLRDALAPHGYVVHGIAVSGCLHLKSAVTAVDDSTVLLNPAWVSRDAFARYRVVEVDPAEAFGANVLRIGDTLVYGASYPRTQARLEPLGHRLRTVDASELAKAEGAVTCCSLILRG
jgi:dimethylargininase